MIADKYTSIFWCDFYLLSVTLLESTKHKWNIPTWKYPGVLH